MLGIRISKSYWMLVRSRSLSNANAVEQSKKAEAEEAAAAFGHKDLCVTLRPK